jgi:hypothetical protein
MVIFNSYFDITRGYTFSRGFFEEATPSTPPGNLGLCTLSPLVGNLHLGRAMDLVKIRIIKNTYPLVN